MGTDLDFNIDLDALEKELFVDGSGRVSLDNGSYIRLGDEEMVAYLYLMPREEGYTPDDIITFMQSMGVFEGYNRSNISAICHKNVYNREIVVAEGKPALKGQDGYYEYFFDTSLHTSPDIREDGSVDYTSMNELPNVNAGDLLAVYHPAVPGENGFNVRGDAISAGSAKELPVLLGKGITRNEDDPNSYYSALDGKAEVSKNRLDVQPIYELHKDVDYAMGKVEFNGDVVIHGNVGTGVLIRAGRNVTITGTVEAAKIVAGGDIILQRGIQGNGKGQIAAKGSIMADFIENTEVEAQADIQSNTLLNSFVKADGTITVNGKKGMIIGGEASALTAIVASNIGNDSEVRTIVHAGYDSTTEDELEDLKNQETDIQAELSKVVDEMKAVLRKKRSQGDRVAEWASRQIAMLNQQKDELMKKLDGIKEERNHLQKLYQAGRSASITVNGNIHRGVLLELCALRTTIRAKDSFKKYFMEGGAIVSNVVVYK
ncbi:MAG: DUF342 domain-containing protein [Lachnospiraceae bacterium]|nr:DUF342 domain-containing protein [Lachnospiraceae bacterium]